MSAFRQIFSFSIIFLFTVLVYGQDEDIALLPDWKVKSIAKTAQLDGDHYLAIEYYEELVARQGESLEILKALADLYWLSKDYINASDAYSRLFEQEPTEGKYLLRYALLEKNLGKPASALTYLERYERKFLDQNPDPETYRLIQQEKEGCEFAINNPPNELIEIFRLPDNLNFPHVEASPVALGDSLFFSSIRINELSYYENELPKAKIYLGEKLSDSLFKVVPHNLPVSDSLYDVGNLSFNHDYTLLAFSKCSKKSPTYYSCELFISRKKNGIWQEPEPMKQLNERGSTQTQPCFALGPDGKQMIYFVSDRSGGIGGKDIWYALQNASGGFSDPKNCGEKLNTAKDEVTPFYNNHLKTLYFSSNGIPGYGGMDIFYINGYASTWASPFNIKAPINSGADDLFYFAEDSASGYFTSNREGVNSLQGATCCDDIFRHYKKKIIEVEIEGSVDFLIPGDKEKNKVNVKLYKDLGGKKVLVKETMADDEGRYRFRVQPDEKYRIVAEKDGYLKAGKSVSTEGIKDDAKISAEQIKLLIETKQPIVIKNIYYPFDEDYLTEASKQNIDTTIFEILAANPTIQVEISSHTDWFGSDAYNQDLSLRRAQSVVNYLIQKGIPEDRLVAAGYGESRPIAPNQNPDGSDNPVGRAKNRRTEFRIVGYLPQYEEILYEE